jgi:hypothetical protein
MRRLVRLLWLALLAVGTLIPTLEALVPCSVQCVDEDPSGDCDTDQCCSCCAHPRIVMTDLVGEREPPSESSRLPASRSAVPVPGAPHDILHVPKSFA